MRCTIELKYVQSMWQVVCMGMKITNCILWWVARVYVLWIKQIEYIKYAFQHYCKYNLERKLQHYRLIQPMVIILATMLHIKSDFININSDTFSWQNILAITYKHTIIINNSIFDFCNTTYIWGFYNYINLDIAVSTSLYKMTTSTVGHFI